MNATTNEKDRLEFERNRPYVNGAADIRKENHMGKVAFVDSECPGVVRFYGAGAELEGILAGSRAQMIVDALNAPKREFNIAAEVAAETERLYPGSTGELSPGPHTVEVNAHPDKDIARNTARTDRVYLSTHDAHCCKIHGCKYGNEDCPVVSGKERGVRCESCENAGDEITFWSEVRALSIVVNAQAAQIGGLENRVEHLSASLRGAQELIRALRGSHNVDAGAVVKLISEALDEL